jgi:hypothetical protein
MAYNLGNLWRRLVLPEENRELVADELTAVLVKTGGRLIKHARYYWLQLAESGLTPRLFGCDGVTDCGLTRDDGIGRATAGDQRPRRKGADGKVCSRFLESGKF